MQKAASINICCSKPKDYHIEYYTSIEDVPQSWDDLIQPNHDLSSAHLRLIEKAQFDDIKHYYCLLYYKKELIAIAYFQRLHLKAQHLPLRQNSAMLRAIKNNLLKVFVPKVLIAGQLFRHDTLNFYSKVFNTIEAYGFYEAMISYMSKKSGACAALVKDAPAQLVPYFKNFSKRFYLIPQDTIMKMPIDSDWEHFDDYEKALKHKYAQKLRKIRAKSQALTIKDLDAESVAQYKTDIYNLYLQVCNKQDASLGFLSEAYLPLLKRNHSQQFRIWGFFDQNNRMQAFVSAWEKPECLDMFYIGINYATNEQYASYFNILYFGVEQAIALHKKHINMGRTALEPKARLGCSAHYLDTFIHIPNLFLRLITFSILRRKTPNNISWESRHPFKSTQ